MSKRETPMLVHLARQCRVTLALLPFVSALPWIDEEVIARTFGQSMRILNWIPEAPNLPERTDPQPRTKEERRLYWREAKRRERRRKAGKSVAA